MHSWRLFVLACLLPALAALAGVVFMPESPRFLLEVSDWSEDGGPGSRRQAAETTSRGRTRSPASRPLRSRDRKRVFSAERPA